MGPDCGTAIVNGIGLGFANKVRKGPIGIVAASGTGLQQVTVRIHQMEAASTMPGYRPGCVLVEVVDAVTARQGLDLMAGDPDARVIVLVSKPPSPKIADALVQAGVCGWQARGGRFHWLCHGLAPSGQRLLCHHL